MESLFFRASYVAEAIHPAGIARICVDCMHGLAVHAGVSQRGGILGIAGLHRCLVGIAAPVPEMACAKKCKQHVSCRRANVKHFFLDFGKEFFPELGKENFRAAERSFF
jgi:hypothetical protein